MTAAEVKAALVGRAEEFARYLFPSGRKDGNEWLVGSLAGEPGESLSICIVGSKTGVWRDFATADTGNNLLELYVRARRVDFATGLKETIRWVGGSFSEERGRSSGRRSNRVPDEKSIWPADIYQATDEECREVCAMIDRLATDDQLLDRIAKARRWKKETIRQIALEGYLGWHQGKLAFIYDSGVKLRWRQNGERIIRWAFGKPWLWRGAYITIPSHTKILLCEGESDVIALLDAGAENDPTKLCVAIPSASTFSEGWASLFDGKDVTLCFDGDHAGSAAADRVGNILSSHARMVEMLDWEGIRRAC